MTSYSVGSHVSLNFFVEAVKRAASREMHITELLEAAEKLKSSGAKQQGADLYKAWIAYHPDDPLLYAAYFNYGVSLSEVPDQAGAVIALREAIRLKPDFFPPYINLGGILDQLGQGDRAVAGWMSLVGALPAVTGDAVVYKAMALKQIGRVLEVANSDHAAEDALRQSLEINQDQPEVVQHWVALRQRQCKWPLMTPWGHVKQRTLSSAISPLSAACYTDDPVFQLSNALHYNKRLVGVPPRSLAATSGISAEQRKPGRLRIGYLSSDLREHAVGFAMTDVVELHDRKVVEIFAYYCGIPASDSTQARIKSAAEHWLDLRGMSDEQAAARIKSDDIDILVDLNGYTKDARTKVFALRPAPIGVNWFGFPNTMGTPYHHYLIADAHIVPPDHEHYYSEKVVRLPCYQPNDRKRVVSARRPSRQEAGLPEDAFVYCSLNGMQKITPATFRRWMSILRGVPGSVLWLLGGTEDANERLKQAATQHGVGAERFVFANKKANPDHLARYPLADLLLDTHPYGSHTTASDALWMGVPVLTSPGRCFASRVCAALVHAAGIGELVCANFDTYAKRAIEFGLDRTKLAPLREKLIAGRDQSLLFDTPTLVRSLEDLYAGMSADHAAGRLPIPDLGNLDIYHEVAMELDLEAVGALSDDAYLAAYRSKLADRHSVFPIRPDQRLLRD